MQTAYLLLVLTLLSPLSAQTGGILRVEPTEINKEITVDDLAEDFEDITSVVVTNNSNRLLQLVQQTVRRPQPGNWTYTSIDRLSQATPYVFSRSEQRSGRQIPLAPGQSATIYVVLRPDGVVGRGSTELRFSDLALPGTVLAAALVTTSLSRREGASAAPQTPVVVDDTPRQHPTSLRLFPNPAAERFFVESPRGTTLGRVEVTNTLGRKIKTFTGAQGTEGYDISKLPDGLYLISLFDDRGKKLKTLRLLHRQFGA